MICAERTGTRKDLKPQKIQAFLVLMVKCFLKVIEKWTEKGKKELSPLSNVAEQT